MVGARLGAFVVTAMMPGYLAGACMTEKFVSILILTAREPPLRRMPRETGPTPVSLGGSEVDSRIAMVQSPWAKVMPIA